MNVNFQTLYELVQKGFKIIKSLEDAGEDFSIAFTAVKNLALKKKEDVTQADMDETHKVLMSELEKFNIELED